MQILVSKKPEPDGQRPLHLAAKKRTICDHYLGHKACEASVNGNKNASFTSPVPIHPYPPPAPQAHKGLVLQEAEPRSHSFRLESRPRASEHSSFAYSRKVIRPTEVGAGWDLAPLACDAPMHTWWRETGGNQPVYLVCSLSSAAAKCVGGVMDNFQDHC